MGPANAHKPTEAKEKPQLDSGAIPSNWGGVRALNEPLRKPRLGPERSLASLVPRKYHPERATSSVTCPF